MKYCINKLNVPRSKGPLQEHTGFGLFYCETLIKLKERLRGITGEHTHTHTTTMMFALLVIKDTNIMPFGDIKLKYAEVVAIGPLVHNSVLDDI